MSVNADGPPAVRHGGPSMKRDARGRAPARGRWSRGAPVGQMYSERSRSSAAFGFAPTMLLSTSPFTKTAMVGIDMIW